MTTVKSIPDWVKDLPEDQSQPWLVKRQEQFISIRQRDGADPYQYHWVLIHEDAVEDFISQVRQEAAKHVATHQRQEHRERKRIFEALIA